MDDLPLHRFSAFVDLTTGELKAMRDLLGHPASFDTGERVRSEGDDATDVFFLHEGSVFSSVTHSDASSQVLRVHQSGDVMGMPSMPYETAVDSLVALTPATVSAIPLHDFGVLLDAFPRLGVLMHLLAQEERVALMDRQAIGGRLGAKHSVVALLLLLFDERPPSNDAGATLHIPMTQTQIGDVLGLSAVHVNRVMSALKAEGLIKRGGLFGHTYELLDVPSLKRMVGMPERVRRRDPTWLAPSRS